MRRGNIAHGDFIRPEPAGGITLLACLHEGIIAVNSVVARGRWMGNRRTIPLALGYSKSNTSPLLHHLLSQAADL